MPDTGQEPALNRRSNPITSQELRALEVTLSTHLLTATENHSTQKDAGMAVEVHQQGEQQC